MFVTAIHFHPSLIFCWNLPERSPLSYATRLACKYKANVQVTASNQHSSLLEYGINYDRKKFYSTGPDDVTEENKEIFFSKI